MTWNPLKIKFNVFDFALMPLMGRWLVEGEWTPILITFPIWMILSVGLEIWGKDKWGWK